MSTKIKEPIHRFRSILNYNYKTQFVEKSDKPDACVPDQSLTIPEIIKRYSSGRSVNVKVYDDFGGDEDHLTGVDIRTMDLVEVSELLQTTKANLMKLQHEQNRRHKEKHDAELEASIIAKYEGRKKADREKDEDNSSPKFIQVQLPLSKGKPENEA